MKNLKYIVLSTFTMLLLFTNCQESNPSFGDIIAPTNVTITAEVLGVTADMPNGDGEGFVTLTADADNAISYSFQFGDGTDEVVPSGEVTHRFSLVGLNTYTVVVNAIGTGGVTSSTAIDVSVFSSFDDLEAKAILSGGGTKTWYWAAAEVGHLGVGGSQDAAPDAYWYPSYYGAQPFEKSEEPCMYNDELIFSIDANDQLTYQLNNNGQTFFNGSHATAGGGSGDDGDVCLDFDTSGVSNVSLAPASSDLPEGESRNTVMNFSDDNFMGYYLGNSSYEILELTNSLLRVRVVDGNDPALVWYHIFSTTLPTQETIDYTDLIWEDDFNTDGTPDATKWGYNIGTGDNGWGNNESQYYTDSPDNVIVEDGVLKITARAEDFLGSDYTSSRLVTEDKFEFTYGRVEISAKLPTGAGTWPAIWMLGEDYATNAWPACGEIDIMEHVGNDQNTIHGTLHYPGNSGGNGDGDSTVVDGVSNEFHTYEVIWSPAAITFLVDGTEFHSYVNSEDSSFNSDFFLIVNVAMGGSFGGAIDAGFVNSTMEIDYIKVYQ